MENLRKKALELASNALIRTDEAIQEFMSQASLPEPLDCKPGCHYCCYNLPVVTPLEALFMGHHVDQVFTDQEKKEIADRIEKILKRIKGMRTYEIVMMRHELPCIFLEDEMCMVYPVRPVVCRACTSTSAEHCKMIFETRDHRARLRCYPQIREIFQTVQTDLVHRSREMGCQSDLLHVAEGIRDYLKHPGPIEAWMEGDIVFNV